MGNGNHCDFLVRQTIVTELSQAEIEAYYDGVTLPPVNNHNQGVAPEYQGLPISLVSGKSDQVASDNSQAGIPRKRWSGFWVRENARI